MRFVYKQLCLLRHKGTLGFTLIELMAAMTLTTLVIAMAWQVWQLFFHRQIATQKSMECETELHAMWGRLERILGEESSLLAWRSSGNTAWGEAQRAQIEFKDSRGGLRLLEWGDTELRLDGMPLLQACSVRSVAFELHTPKWQLQFGEDTLRGIPRAWGDVWVQRDKDGDGQLSLQEMDRNGSWQLEGDELCLANGMSWRIETKQGVWASRLALRTPCPVVSASVQP